MAARDALLSASATSSTTLIRQRGPNQRLEMTSLPRGDEAGRRSDRLP